MGAMVDMRDAAHPHRSAPSLGGRTRRACACIALALALAAPASARAADVVATGFLYDAAGRPVAMTTSERDLYFAFPSRWAIAHGSAAVQLAEAADAAGDYDLRLVLAPDYGGAAPVLASVRAEAPHALFFPVPMTVERATLFLPEELGSIEAELTPDDGQLSTPLALYYRIRLSAPQLASLRMASRSGLALQGALVHRYAAPDGTGESAAPLTILLAGDDLTLGSDPEPPPGAWLAALLASAKLSLPRIVDGSFALGGGVQVGVVDSRLEASFLPGSYALRASEGGFAVAPTRDANLTGSLRMRVRELGLTVTFDVKLAVEAQLDLTTMQLAVTRCSLREARLNGASNPFYTALLRKLTARPELQARVADALSAELQRRILQETLFGLEDLW